CDFRGSCQPYCRYLPQDSFLDFFDIAENSTIEEFSKIAWKLRVEKCNWDLGVQARLWYDRYIWLLCDTGLNISLSVCEPHGTVVKGAIRDYRKV
ncbi:hypothetical protein BHM03_00004744, partial [Ensete ventricosum]